MVPRRQVRHLGALGSAIGRRRRRLVCPQHVHAGQRAMQISRRCLRPSSKFGFKDVIPTWKGDKFDPDHLVSLYKKAGAKYFVSMGVHHDNFDLWNSKHTRWNAVNMGPRKDVVGMFRNAAMREGLKFGVSEHLWISYKWFSVSHGS